MASRKAIVVEPRSRFLVVQCPECNNDQIIFSHASREIKCTACSFVLAKPSGGKATILGEVTQVLE